MKTTMTLMFMLVCAAALAEPVDATRPANVAEEGPHDWLIKHPTINQLVVLANHRRAQVGMPPVTLDTQMCLDAQRHAKWMADFGGFQHSGLPYMEIIYQSVQTPELAIDGWVASPPHYGIMVSHSTRVGFGYAKSSGGYPYWVGVFR
jgi:uncharacterized protein YkwD